MKKDFVFENKRIKFCKIYELMEVKYKKERENKNNNSQMKRKIMVKNRNVSF